MSATNVITSYGQVSGEEINGVSVWKGIPYAKAPVGNLRFRPPQIPEAWDGIYDATQFGPSAIQPVSEIMNFLGSDINETSEDCLRLNIWSQKADGKLRPVMVWIHGGAFMNGSGSSLGYDGTSFALESDVVIVTINYRLGVLGFLHLGDIGGEAYASSGNCGILDQIAALKWIKENIEAFGGDPTNITLFGESAGAMSIGILLAVPEAKGLFNKAILQSGAARNVLNRMTANHVTSGILANLGVGVDELSKLEEIPIEKLLDAAKNVPPMALGPVLDGMFISEHPEISIANGSSKDIPILIGTNKDEYRLFTFFDPSWKGLNKEEIELRFERSLRKWSEIAQHYLNAEHMNQALYEKLMSFEMFTSPAIWLAEKQTEQGSPVWMYRFEWETPILNGGLKSCHALEIPFVFHGIDKEGAKFLLGSSPDKTLANQMHASWSAFAKNGNPNTSGVPEWSLYDLENRETMIFDVVSKMKKDPDQKERVIWESALLKVD